MRSSKFFPIYWNQMKPSPVSSLENQASITNMLELITETPPCLPMMNSVKTEQNLIYVYSNCINNFK